MKRLLLAGCALAVMGALHARAATLHMCYTDGCKAFDGVTINSGPASGDLDGWGFATAPGGGKGTLTIDLLVPTNEKEVILPTLTNSVLPASDISGWTLVSHLGSTVFNTGNLTDFMGSPFAGLTPPNPYSSYTSATKAFDPGLTGYNVYEVTVKNWVAGSAGGQTSALGNFFDLTGGDYDLGSEEFTGIGPGAILTGFLAESVTKKGVTTIDYLSTAQSESLVLDGVGTRVGSIPEPRTWVSMTLGFALLAVAGWRKAKRSAALEAAAL
jgi:hypothetical protein